MMRCDTCGLHSLVPCARTDCGNKERPAILPWTLWHHHSGKTYGVLGLSNNPKAVIDTKKDYPLTVIYFSIEDPTMIYTGAASDWHRRMTVIPNEYVPGRIWDDVISFLANPS